MYSMVKLVFSTISTALIIKVIPLIIKYKGEKI